MKKPGLNEDFICRIWEDRSNYNDLKTLNDERVEVIEFGVKNYDAGPDYKNARVKIEGIVYAGSIEIHRTVKDWYLHNHKGDNKYNDVILHVVFYEDESEENSVHPKVKKSRSIPTVILSEHLSRSVHEIWKEIINNPSPAFKLPCYPENASVVHSVKTGWISYMGMERLKFKKDRIRSNLEVLNSDIRKKSYWEKILFRFICESLGYSKNKEQFLKLSEKIDPEYIRKRDFSLIEIESMLFGLAGFLYDLNFKDRYIFELKTHWQKINSELKKEWMDKSEWNFFRLRPPNFPTLRIAYASGVLYDIIKRNLLKDIIGIFENGNKVKRELEERFSEIHVSEYWNHHYNFGRISSRETNSIGKERIKDIIVNVILPLVYLYSEFFDKINLKKRVVFFYNEEKQKSGGNEVIRVMEKQIDVKVRSISDEQGLIQLHNNYCVKGKCSECEIGKIVFSNEKVNEPLRIILY
ncbi:MAG TPA: DUF2851 family protein [Ignavibacteria bacterium]|nr:DUF2851 family protein [Ignavibacteria bacterium]